MRIPAHLAARMPPRMATAEVDKEETERGASNRPQPTVFDDILKRPRLRIPKFSPFCLARFMQTSTVLQDNDFSSATFDPFLTLF